VGIEGALTNISIAAIPYYGMSLYNERLPNLEGSYKIRRLMMHNDEAALRRF